MKNICLIGAGNIGSRHLQALKKVSFPLSIEVVETSPQSLETAKERYQQIDSNTDHQISFFQNITQVSKKIDLAIIATTAQSRRIALEELLSHSNVEYLILEKLLFPNFQDYARVKNLLKKKVNNTWVNFSMRTMPFYCNLKEKIRGNNVQLIVSGANSQYGLVTNAIHFVDYISYLCDDDKFTVSTNSLDKHPINSKRPGFLELNGTLTVHFNKGSFGAFTAYPKGDAPYIIEINSPNLRCISKESEKKAWLAEEINHWQWSEVDSHIPYQSEMTNIVAETIFKTGSCLLTPYNKACKSHLQLLEPLLAFLNQYSTNQYSAYPFT